MIGIEADDLRLLNDRGRPFLYPGERYSYPRLLNIPGFFEDFFDADESAVATFWRTVNERLAVAAAA